MIRQPVRKGTKAARHSRPKTDGQYHQPRPVNAEREMLRQAARDFAMQEVLPLANRLDPEKADMPRSLIAKLAEFGYFGITIAEKHGRLRLGCFEYCLIAEELSRAWMSWGRGPRQAIRRAARRTASGLPPGRTRL